MCEKKTLNSNISKQSTGTCPPIRQGELLLLSWCLNGCCCQLCSMGASYWPASKNRLPRAPEADIVTVLSGDSSTEITKGNTVRPATNEVPSVAAPSGLLMKHCAEPAIWCGAAAACPSTSKPPTGKDKKQRHSVGGGGKEGLNTRALSPKQA